MPVAIVRSLDGGGDQVVRGMMNTSASIGVDIIELIWTKDRGPRYAIARVFGFQFPVVNASSAFDGDITANQWIDEQLKFYPDSEGRCWGYIWDTPANRYLLCQSLSTGWYRIVDKKVREEIIKQAQEMGLSTEAMQQTIVNVKKSVVEVKAEKEAAEYKAKMLEMQRQLEVMQRKFEEATNVRNVSVEKRLKGTPVPQEKQDN